MAKRANKKNNRTRQRDHEGAIETSPVEIETQEISMNGVKKVFFKIAHVVGTLFVWVILNMMVVTFGLSLVDAAIQERFGATDSILTLVMSVGVVSAVFGYSLWLIRDIYRAIGWAAYQGFPRLMRVFEKASQSRENLKKQGDAHAKKSPDEMNEG